jgi:hypothetical protein
VDPKCPVSQEQILELVFPYLESDLPAILLLPGHAVCVVGFILDKERQSGTLGILSAASWISGLIIHDDARGPYRIITLENGRKRPDHWPRWAESSLKLQDVHGMLVPLPERVYLDAALVELHVRSALNSDSPASIYDLLIKDGTLVPESVRVEWERCRSGQRDAFVIRTYLVDAMEYIAALRSGDYEGFPEKLYNRYASRIWPRMIWITEVTTDQRMERRVSGHKEVVIGEFIVDPTANRYGNIFLAIHVPGVVLEFPSGELYQVDGDQGYSYGHDATYPREIREL